MNFPTKTGNIFLLVTTMLLLSGDVYAQDTAELSESATESGTKELHSAAERTMDWLNTQITPPQDESESSGGFQVFSDPEARHSAIKTGATLTMVLSIFLLLLFVWRLRPGSKKLKKGSNAVLSVIGQIPFVQGQQLQLVRLGTRLLLVATSPGGSQTLSEICDPAEVLQIESACRHGQMDLLTAALQERARQNSAMAKGVSLGSHPQGGRTLLEA